MIASRSLVRHAKLALAAPLLVSCAPLPAAHPAPLAPLVDDTRRASDTIVADARAAAARGDRVRAAALYESALQTWESFADAKTTLLRTAVTPWVRRTSSIGTALSPDGRVLAATWRGNDIALFDIGTWQLIALFGMHKGPVTSLVFSRSPVRLWTIDEDGAVCRLDPATGKHNCTAGEENSQPRDKSIALAPNGESIVFPCKGKLCFWRVAQAAPDPFAVPAPAACPNPRAWLDGARVMTQDDRGRVCMVDLTGTSRELLPEDRNVAFSSQSPLIIDQAVQDWRHAFVRDMRTGRVVATLENPPADVSPREGMAWVEAVSPDGSLVAGTVDSHVVTWNATDGRFLAARLVPLQHQVTFLANGQVLVAEPHKQRFAVYSADHLEERGGHRSPVPVVPGIAVSSDSKRMALWFRDRARVWSLEDGSVSPVTFPPANRLPLAEVMRFLGGSKWLALGNRDGLVVAEVATGKEVFRRPSPRQRRLTAIGLDHGGGNDVLVVVSTDSGDADCRDKCTGYVERFDLATGEPTAGPVASIARHRYAQLSDDTRVLMTASDRSAILIWDLPDAKLRLRAAASLRQITLSPDGRQIAWSDAGETIERVRGHLHLVDTTTGEDRVALTKAGVHHPGGWLADSSALVVMENASVANPPGARMGVVDTGTARILRESNAPMECGINLVSPDGRFAGGACDNNEKLVLGDLRRPHVWVRIQLEEDSESWVAEDPAGRIDYGGPKGAAMLGCQVGPWVLPIELCEHRFRTLGLLATGLFAPTPL